MCFHIYIGKDNDKCRKKHLTIDMNSVEPIGIKVNMLL